jgi:exodeoxyribonuclease VII small subunit
MSLNQSKNTSASISPNPDWSYEETVSKAEKIIHNIESGKLSLSEVFEQFSLASDYLRQCELFLEQKRREMDLSVEYLQVPIQES